MVVSTVQDSSLMYSTVQDSSLILLYWSLRSVWRPARENAIFNVLVFGFESLVYKIWTNQLKTSHIVKKKEKKKKKCDDTFPPSNVEIITLSMVLFHLSLKSFHVMSLIYFGL